MDLLFEALEQGRFHFEKEQWHDLEACLQSRDDPAPCELLLRATTPEGALIPHEALIRAVTIHQLQSPFDTAIILAAMDQAIREESFPVSINVSALAASDPLFWTDLQDQLQHFFKDRFDPAQVTFELTEDGPADNVAVATLMDMKAQGYAFAIDDLSHTDLRRLKNLGPFVSMVKIDGKTLLAAEAGTLSLHDFLHDIRAQAPSAAILAEWVTTPHQASKLHQDFNINYVSGRALEADTKHFSQQVRQARQESHLSRSTGPV